MNFTRRTALALLGSTLVPPQGRANTLVPNWGATIIPWSTSSPRHDHQQIVALDDDTLRIVWCEYYGGGDRRNDQAPCRIRQMDSTDSGRTWSDRRTLIENTFARNVKHPNLIPLSAQGHWLITYTGWNNNADRNVYGRKSADNLETLGPQFQISEPGWYCNTAGHAVKLSTGRILLPTHGPYAPDYIGHAAFTGGDLWSFCFISDDEGETWQRSSALTTNGRGLHEGTIVELNDGSLLQFFRNNQGRQYESRSYDGGLTWTPAAPTPLNGMESPSVLCRLSNGNILLVFNNRSSSENGRIPLTAAISSNEGKAWPAKDGWRIIGDIDDRIACDAAYPSVIEFKGQVLIAYYTKIRSGNGAGIALRVYPVSAFD